MLIETQSNGTITNKSAQGSAMTVNITGTSFNFILDNLYTQPHRAIVRELSCNAWDAHMQAHNTEPFKIQVPSKFNPTFMIRDYGVGLDAEEIDKYLNTLYQSSKTESNDQIGGFGLGAKSPFALVQSFFISSYKNGIEYKCFWYRDAEGIPVLKVQSELETTEPNGIKYVVNFALKDVQGIINACSSELLGLPVPPRFFSDIEDDETEFDLIGQAGITRVASTPSYLIFNDTGRILQDTFIQSSSYYRSNCKILLSVGGVLYPLPSSLEVSTLVNTVPGFSSLYLTGTYFVINLPIGSVKLPSTREHILDIPQNIEVITEHAEACFKYFISTLKDRYLAVLGDQDYSSLSVHLKHLYKYCTDQGISFNGSVLAFIDDSVVIDGAFAKAVPLKYKDQTTAAILLSEHVAETRSVPWASNPQFRKDPIFQLKVVDPTTFRTESSRYSSFDTLRHAVKATKPLIVLDDTTKFMGAWLRGLSDISEYSEIFRCKINPVLGEAFSKDYDKLAEELFNSYGIKGKLIRSSDLVKPAVVSSNGVAAPSVTPAVYPGIRVAKNPLDFNDSYVQGADSILKMKDSKGNYIPFDSSYITAEGCVVYVVKDVTTHIDYRLHYYYQTFKPHTTYYIKASQEKDLLAALKASPKVTQIVKVDNTVKPNLDHLDPDLISQFFKMVQIWTELPSHRYRKLFLEQSPPNSFDKLDQTELARLTNVESNYPSDLSGLITDKSIVSLIFTNLQGFTKDYATSTDMASTLCQLDDQVLLETLSKSLPPLVFSIVTHLLSNKE